MPSRARRTGRSQSTVPSDLTRRDFLTQTGAASAVLTLGACGVLIPRLNPNEPFDPGKFDWWFRYAKLYSGSNPNLCNPHRPGIGGQTFQDAIDHRYTPGVSYRVPTGEVMVAVASGPVFEWGEIRGTGRPEGR